MMPSCNALHQPRADEIDERQGREKPADAIERMRQMCRAEGRLHKRRTDCKLDRYRAEIHEQALYNGPLVKTTF